MAKFARLLVTTVRDAARLAAGAMVAAREEAALVCRERRRIGRGLANAGVRFYALGIFAVVCLATYMAVAYLVRFVFFPTPVPQRLVQWQGRLDVAALRQSDVPGVTRDAARAPIGHYHGVERWFEPDPHNSCTIPGCHSPLPHTKRLELRAFSNLHASFLACSSCHSDPVAKPTAAQWVGTATGQVQEPPALLKLVRYFETNPDAPRVDPSAAHAVIVGLLGQALQTVGSDPLLEYLGLQIKGAEPGSPVWRKAVEQLAAELPLHARGEYGAKLVLRDAVGLEAAEMARQAKQYLQAGGDELARAKLKESIHAGVRVKPEGCLTCHGGQPTLLDFEALGYSPQRAALLRGVPLANFMRQLQEGQSVHLLRVLGGGE